MRGKRAEEKRTYCIQTSMMADKAPSNSGWCDPTSVLDNPPEGSCGINHFIPMVLYYYKVGVLVDLEAMKLAT